jgi:KaiC/GvpD/RAD55 family RecA-like ATPase
VSLSGTDSAAVLNKFSFLKQEMTTLREYLVPFSVALAGDAGAAASERSVAGADTLQMRSCGVDSLNHCFGGGFPASRMMEISGYASSGRTSLCLSMAATCALSGQSVVYIDITNAVTSSLLKSFFLRCASERAQRPIVSTADTDEAALKAMENFKLLRIFDYYSLVQSLHTLASTLPTKHVLIVDGMDRILSCLDPLTSQCLVSSLYLQLRALNIEGTTVIFTNLHRPPKLSAVSRTASDVTAANLVPDGLSMYFGHILQEFVDIHIKLSMRSMPLATENLVRAGKLFACGAKMCIM